MSCADGSCGCVSELSEIKREMANFRVETNEGMAKMNMEIKETNEGMAKMGETLARLERNQLLLMTGCVCGGLTFYFELHHCSFVQSFRMSQ